MKIGEITKADLLPCDCGCNDLSVYRDNYYYIKCPKCGLTMSNYERVPVAEWNSRPSRLAELEKKIAKVIPVLKALNAYYCGNEIDEILEILNG